MLDLQRYLESCLLTEHQWPGSSATSLIVSETRRERNINEFEELLEGVVQSLVDSIEDGDVNADWARCENHGDNVYGSSSQRLQAWLSAQVCWQISLERMVTLKCCFMVPLAYIDPAICASTSTILILSTNECCSQARHCPAAISLAELEHAAICSCANRARVR